MSIRAVPSAGSVHAAKSVRPAPALRVASKQPVDGFEPARPVVVLRRGATGSSVRALQLKLVSKGYLARNDFASGAGVFGPRTETAVKRLQVEAGLPVTGIVDQRTAVALNTERPARKHEVSEVATDVFEKPHVAAQTVTDDDDDLTVPPEGPVRAAG